MQTSQSQHFNEYADYNQHIQLKILILANESADLPIFRLPVLRNPKLEIPNKFKKVTGIR
jgi:hypothetical protein